jgi:Oxygen-sensitive ribonucleoside-triphosphate reductase
MQINITAHKDFVDSFNKLSSKYGVEMARLNGFGVNQLSYTDFIDNFIDKEKNVADASIDGSANVSHKDVVSLEHEMNKPHLKLLAANKIFFEITKKYGLETAENWLESEWIGHLYLHDFHSSTMVPYCYAYDIERLVTEGLFFVENFNCQPPKHLNTFTDFVGEFVSWTCNRSAGAVGLPSFLVYSYWFWKKDVENGYYLKSPEYYRDQNFQEIVYKLNQPYLRGGIQSSFTNMTIFDREYLAAMFGGKAYPDGTYIIDFIEDILEYQKHFMEKVSEIRSKNMMTFPVLTYSLLRQNGKFADEEFAKWCCQHNMKWADSNFFISDDITVLSNCCRLLSDIKQLGYFNSIGGTALEVGSVKVNTINLARIAYESTSKSEYFETLESMTELCLQSLDCVRHIISRNIEKGLLPNYSLDIMKLESQYNTIGIIGIFEALQKFRYTDIDKFGNMYYSEDGITFAKEILAKIITVKEKFSQDKDYLISLEEIPGETCASVLMAKDKLIYPNEEYTLPLYGNQWIPLGIKTTLNEKIRLSAILDKACSGGSIAHINIASPFTSFEIAWDLLNYISDQGVVYFAFNLKINSCENNHGFFEKICPYCGKEIANVWSRVVGFISPESSYSKPRKEEFQLRDWSEI